MGLGLAWAAWNPAHRRVVHLGATTFLVAHALVHVGELLGGTLPPHHWLPDVPSVFLPPLLFLALAPAALRRDGERPAG